MYGVNDPRSVVSERRETDRMLVSSSADVTYYYDSENSMLFILVTNNFGLLYSSNLIITFAGLYFLPKIMYQHFITLRTKFVKELRALYWAVVIICAVLNTTCVTVYFVFTEYDEGAAVVPLFVMIFVEIVSAWIIIGDDCAKMGSSLLCCSNRYVLKAIHTLAFCQVLWFLHRVGCNLLVSIFFIALAPTQTIAALLLIYFTVFCSILYVAYVIYSCTIIECERKKVPSNLKKIFKLILVSLFYLLVITFLIFFTLLYVELAENGLTSSGLGNVILSLVAPTIVFIVTLKIKRELEFYYKPSVLKDQPNNDERAQDRDNKLSVNTPLLN